MKVLLINGSPHEKGCTYTALSLIAGELNAQGIETEILHVGGQPGTSPRAPAPGAAAPPAAAAAAATAACSAA